MPKELKNAFFKLSILYTTIIHAYYTILYTYIYIYILYYIISSLYVKY